MRAHSPRAANLELLRNLRTGEAKQSLFGALNHCITSAGTRYLRSSLLQPSCDLATIAARLDAVTEVCARVRRRMRVSRARDGMRARPVWVMACARFVCG